MAKDPATLNRYITVFHDAASPQKTVNILKLKGYLKEKYGIEGIEPAAMKAVYILGLRTHPKPSAHTSAEQYFLEVVKAAQEAGKKNITLDFVFDHYDRHHAAKLGGRGALTAATVDSIFAYETREMQEQNGRDRERLRKIETETGGAKRVNGAWWEMGGEGIAYMAMPDAERIEMIKARLGEELKSPEFNFKEQLSPADQDNMATAIDGILRQHPDALAEHVELAAGRVSFREGVVARTAEALMKPEEHPEFFEGLMRREERGRFGEGFSARDAAMRARIFRGK
jgi:hypothetical protein